MPGLAEVLARPFLPTSILIREDLPTLERPIKAISGLSAGSGKNRKLFIVLAVLYTSLFAGNLLLAPYFLGYVLQLPQIVFTLIFSLIFFIVGLNLVRVFANEIKRRRALAGLIILLPLMAFAYYRYVPKDMILEKAQKQINAEV